MEISEIIGKYWPVLDKGFISLVDVMGDDEAIEQAARVSYGKGTRKTSETRGLIRYLMRHHHTTPFEMVELKFHIRIPMDAWRQMVRHRTANINEYSTRYSEAINACQTTKEDEWRLQSKNNKQGSSGFIDPMEHITIDSVFTPGTKDTVQFAGKSLTQDEAYLHHESRRIYEERLRMGVAKEQARKDLPLSNYTMLYWKCDLHNIFNFLRLRCDGHAQKEIRDYANLMAGMVKVVAPVAFEGWMDYVFGAKLFSRQEMGILQDLYTFNEEGWNTELHKSDIQKFKEISGLSDREFAEFEAKLAPQELPDFNLDLSAAKPPQYFEDQLCAS